MTLLLLACTGSGPAEVAPATGHEALELAAAGMPVLVRRRLELDPGSFVDGAWVGAPEVALRVVGPGGALSDGSLELGIGANEVTVERGCGPVVVGVRADPGVEVVSVPYPTCAVVADAPVVPGSPVSLDRRERPVSDVLALQSIGLLRDVPLAPGTDDLPARWLTRAEAEAACAFFGGRLPGLREVNAARGEASPWASAELVGALALDRAPTRGPAGHEDLGGNVAEWLLADPADGPGGEGTVAGPSFLRGAPTWAVPSTARSDEIGFRCAYGR